MVFPPFFNRSCYVFWNYLAILADLLFCDMHLRGVFWRLAGAFGKFTSLYPATKLAGLCVVGHPLDQRAFPDSGLCPFQLSVGGVVGVESGEASEPPTFSNRVKIVSS